MFKPPKGLSYRIVSKEEYLAKMAEDVRLGDIARKRMAAEKHVSELRAVLKDKKREHKSAFWSLWKAECDLSKAKIRLGENSKKWKTGWQKRCWDIFKALRVKTIHAKKKKNKHPE